MSEPKSQKTEKAIPKRQREAKKKARSPSRPRSGVAASFITALLVLRAFGPTVTSEIFGEFQHLMGSAGSNPALPTLAWKAGVMFALDAMPGKQMAIDADLGSGLINEALAREMRAKIAKEADFYGAMDGASKFVKGDAIAGVIITSINLIGGMATGLGGAGLSFGEAVDTYSRLSVGDGLVSRIPALLISIATSLLVTRVGSDNALGASLSRQVFGNPEALRIGSIVLAGMGL